MYVFDTPDCGTVAWILPPKTGTRSVEKHIRIRSDALCKGGRHGVIPGVLRDVRLKVASIRNPFDVLVSWFHYHPSGRKSKSFGHWLGIQTGGDKGAINYLEKSTLPQAHWADEYCRYELGLEAEVNRLWWKFGWRSTRVELGHIGKAEERKAYREYYDDQLREMVEIKYAADFENFDYEF